MNIGIIVGSVRPNRSSSRVARWAQSVAGQDLATILELADYPLSFFDEPIPPRYNQERQPNEQTKAWLDAVAACDAYVIVTPEYNHSIPGVLKNALDHIDYQLQDKPVVLIGHGSVGGARSIEHLKNVLNILGATVLPGSDINVRGHVDELFDEQGVMSEAADTAMTDSLKASLAKCAEFCK